MLGLVIITKDSNFNCSHDVASNLEHALSLINMLTLEHDRPDVEIYLLKVTGDNSGKYYMLDGNWSDKPFNLNLR
ncbi:hypothetical protein [Pseudoalteromonas luteoviolacea]|uniref:hypothetical protein n=1 Tax=Pseudoalteromonas luteoviolacea TaxID=43657 RepID=UPI001B35A874|nr:hypothetical protein [Pseudoalteromonas luteoviolacea]MBQ4839860.1 hypothetical protein [Pseudoalteromonas luteoviolacea]